MGVRMVILAAAFAGLAPAASARDITVGYRCEDGTRLIATFRNPPQGGPGAAELVFDPSGYRTTLPQGLSADGGRYAAGGTQFWIRGRDATLTRGGRATRCAAEPGS